MSGASMRPEQGDEWEVASTPDEVRAELKKILTSRGFAQSQRLSRFLRLIVQRAINGQPDLNEYSLGVEVFDKRADFDPRIDPNVRVHARRLRERLREYYAAEGAHDPIEIELPIRSYVPVIRKRRPQVITGPSSLWSEVPEAANSVAVLPFTSLSSEREDEYFARGLTQELIHALVGVKDLRVVSWAGTAPQLSRWFDVRELGKQLRVQAVLEGTLRRTAERRVRVSVQLISVADGSVLWSKMNESDVDFTIPSQERLARVICSALRVRIESGRMVNRGADTPEPRQLFPRAQYQGGKCTREGLEKCIASLRAVLSTDPEYAAAHAALGEALMLMVVYGEARPDDLAPKARAAALRALECDSSLADAHVLLGIIAAMYDWDMPRAEFEFFRAIELAPNSSHALNWYSTALLIPSARFEEAIRHLRRAQELDPLSLAVVTSLGYAFYASERPRDALRELNQVIDLEPNFALARWALGLVHQELGNIRNAITEFEQACELSGGMAFALGSLGNACAASGQTGRALQVLEGLHGECARRYVPAVDIGLIHVGLHQHSEALACFDKAYRERCAWVTRVKIDPRLRSLRPDEQFGRFLQKLGASAPPS